MAVIIDISSEKEKEAALQESEANMHGLIENSNDLIWSVDNNYDITLINSTAKAFLFTVFQKDFSIGHNFLNNLPAEKRSIWVSRFDQGLNSQSFNIIEDFTQNEQVLHYEISFNPIIYLGKVQRVSVIARDITDYQNLMLKLKDTNITRTIQLNDTIRRLEDEIKERKTIEKSLLDAKVFAEAANRAKSDFLANMSHELRTPLNAIIGFSEIMLDEAKNNQEDQKIEFLSLIHDGGKHLLSLINQILDVGRFLIHLHQFRNFAPFYLEGSD